MYLFFLVLIDKNGCGPKTFPCIHLIVKEGTSEGVFFLKVTLILIGLSILFIFSLNLTISTKALLASAYLNLTFGYFLEDFYIIYLK